MVILIQLRAIHKNINTFIRIIVSSTLCILNLKIAMIRISIGFRKYKLLALVWGQVTRPIFMVGNARLPQLTQLTASQKPRIQRPRIKELLQRYPQNEQGKKAVKYREALQKRNLWPQE
jgi:hypothetical protein